ncbi:extracellular solute-binding protein [Neorhizobium galegae]|uniref:extracellular solute-binding protein n=1 Tax=Neorhizobium galegae TaxID=399 RepID=UPI0006222A32|nr:extracellular solute-binding protein [Neorhizobium galegae]CDZ60096.1 Putative Spermidine/putrescine ABC transpoter (Substrate binding protein) [Neorhizobium galegae bv. orientalis]CDZ64753.1 Putative Spermidine/putrescine ABC transpoter (Substrate binding protein) [Neorhizobium galegae bv. orientalis]
MIHGTSRRQFLGGVGAAGLAMGSGIRPTFAQAKAGLDMLKGQGNIVVCTWGGGYSDTMKRIWFEPFGKSTGINVSTTSIPDMSKLEVMEKVGNVEWDLVDTEGVQMQIAIKKGLLQPIDYDLIFSIVPKEQIDPKVITKYGIGSVAFSTVIAWNHDLFGAAGPQTWAEWFDTTRFKGRRALYAQPRPSFEIALMAAGVPKDKIYPINIDDAFKALDAIRSKVNLWVEKTSQWAVLMQNGEVDLMGSSLARTLEEKKRTGKIDFSFNQSIVEQSYWTIPKSAPGGKESQKLIAWMMQAEGMLKYASALPFNVANTSIYANIPKDMQVQLPGFPENAAKNMHIDEAWWAENTASVQPRWLEWMSRA